MRIQSSHSMARHQNPGTLEQPVGIITCYSNVLLLLYIYIGSYYCAHLLIIHDWYFHIYIYILSE